MPRVDIRRERPRVPEGAPGVTMPAYPRAAAWEGAEMERLGATLRDVGGDFATLGMRMKQLQIREEISDGIIDYENQRDVQAVEWEKDTNYAEKGQLAIKWLDATSPGIRAKAKTKQAQAQLDDYFRSQRGALFNKWQLHGSRQLAAQVRYNWRTKVQQAVRNGREAQMIEQIDEYQSLGVITEEDTELFKTYMEEYGSDWRQQQLIAGTRARAMEVLATSGLDAAKDWLKAQELDVPLWRKLEGEVEFAAKRSESEDDARVDAAITAQIDTFTGLLRDPNGSVELSEVEASDLWPDDRVAWSKIAEGQFDPEPETDWKKYIDLEETLFDRWIGTVSKRNLQTNIANARYGEQYLNDWAWQEIDKRSLTEMPDELIGPLKQGFEAIKQSLQATWHIPYLGWRTVEAWHLSQGEARKIAYARKALFSSIMEQKGRKKDITLEDVLVRAKQFAIAYREPRVRVRGPDGKTGSIPMKSLEEALERGLELAEIE